MKQHPGFFSRRSALRIGLGSIAAPSPRLPSCAQQPARMVVVSSGGVLEDAYREAIYKPWTAKTGIEIVTGPNPSAKLKAMVDAGAMEWDVVQLDAAVTAAAARQDLLLAASTTGWSTRRTSWPAWRATNMSSPICAGTLLAWNTDVLKGAAPPADWAADVGYAAAIRPSAAF